MGESIIWYNKTTFTRSLKRFDQYGDKFSLPQTEV